MSEQTGCGAKSAFTFTLRRGRVLFITVMLIIILAVIWPGYMLFSAATPFILGFPLSFAWIILWVMVGFAAMLALYISDSRHEPRD